LEVFGGRVGTVCTTRISRSSHAVQVAGKQAWDGPEAYRSDAAAPAQSRPFQWPGNRTHVIEMADYVLWKYFRAFIATQVIWTQIKLTYDDSSRGILSQKYHPSSSRLTCPRNLVATNILPAVSGRCSLFQWPGSRYSIKCAGIPFYRPVNMFPSSRTQTKNVSEPMRRKKRQGPN